MSVVSHLVSLRKKHQELKDQIANAYLHHYRDDEIMAMKKYKLRIKEQIAYYEKMQGGSMGQLVESRVAA